MSQGSFFLASKEKQDEILRILSGSGEGGLASKAQAEAILQKLEEGGGSGAFGKGMARYQQPTHPPEFYIEPSGSGLKVAWKDPQDQFFYDKFGLADSVWVKTRLVYKEGSYPENDTDGVYIDSVVRDSHYVKDGTDLEHPNWIYIDVDNTKKMYFRFFTYGHGAIINDAEHNQFLYEPNVKKALILGASREKMYAFFNVPANFGRNVRIGLGLGNDILNGVDMSQLDNIATYDDFLANKPLRDEVAKYNEVFQKSVVLTNDDSILIRYLKSEPIVIYQVLIDAVIASDTAMRAVAASDTAMRAVAASDTAMQIITRTENLIVLLKAFYQTDMSGTVLKILPKTGAQTGNFKIAGFLSAQNGTVSSSWNGTVSSSWNGSFVPARETPIQTNTKINGKSIYLLKESQRNTIFSTVYHYNSYSNEDTIVLDLNA